MYECISFLSHNLSSIALIVWDSHKIRHIPNISTRPVKRDFFCAKTTAVSAAWTLLPKMTYVAITYMQQNILYVRPCVQHSLKKIRRRESPHMESKYSI